MATVAPLRTSASNSKESRGKVPSFAAEAGLFMEDDAMSDCGMTSMAEGKEPTKTDSHPVNGGAADPELPGADKIKSTFHGSNCSDLPSLAASAISPQEDRGNDDFVDIDDDDGALEEPFGSLEQRGSDVDADWNRERNLHDVASPPHFTPGFSNAFRNSADYATPTNSGPTTPVSEYGRVTPLNYSAQQEAASFNSNSSSAPRSTMRPVLYSAIGSLESYNATSMGSLNKRLLQTSRRDFCQMAGAATQNMSLIPPVAQVQTQINTSAKSTGGTTVNNRNAVQSQPKAKLPKSDASSSDNGNTNNSSAKPSDSVKNNTSDAKRLEPASTTTITKKPSNLRPSTRVSAEDNMDRSVTSRASSISTDSRKVTYKEDTPRIRRRSKPVEMFRPSCDAYTPRMEKKKIQYKPADKRDPVQKMASPMGTLQRPNFRDALRRVAMIIHQHIVKIERRFDGDKLITGKGLFRASMRETFHEDLYCTPKYKCSIIRIPMARPGMVYGLRKIRAVHAIPSEEEIYEFAHQLFNSVQLSSECSIVCLIYVERLMEVGKVPLLACTWRPVFMSGLLLASKVWQDLSSWNIEFATVYPQYSLDAINRLELNFLRMCKWDLYISSSLYAKYYFALRSLVEKRDFRQRYNRMVGGVDSVARSEALKIQKRTEQVKEEALLHLSRSME